MKPIFPDWFNQGALFGLIAGVVIIGLSLAVVALVFGREARQSGRRTSSALDLGVFVLIVLIIFAGLIGAGIYTVANGTWDFFVQ